MANALKVGERFKCKKCGNIVEIVEIGGGQLFCCGQPMELIE